MYMVSPNFGIECPFEVLFKRFACNEIIILLTIYGLWELRRMMMWALVNSRSYLKKHNH